MTKYLLSIFIMLLLTILPSSADTYTNVTYNDFIKSYTTVSCDDSNDYCTFTISSTSFTSQERANKIMEVARATNNTFDLHIFRKVNNQVNIQVHHIPIVLISDSYGRYSIHVEGVIGLSYKDTPDVLGMCTTSSGLINALF